MAKKAAALLGAVLLAAGLMGFAAPSLLGAHLGFAHNSFHIVTGTTSLYFGTKGTRDRARAFCLGFGGLYLLLAIAGFAFGAPGASEVAHAAHDARLLRLVPGVLELGTSDHWIHVVVSSAYLLAGIMTKRVSAPLAPR